MPTESIQPASPPPSLDGITDALKLEKMKQWFRANFESASARPQGDAPDTSGGSNVAVLEINDAFGGQASLELINKAAAELDNEAGASAWVPKDSRIGLTQDMVAEGREKSWRKPLSRPFLRRGAIWIGIAAAVLCVGLAGIVVLALRSAIVVSPSHDEGPHEEFVGTPAKTALDIIRMQACEIAWNEHIDEANASSTDVTTAYVPTSNPRGSPTGYPYVIGNITGTKYAFSSNTTADVDVCGWYFIPDGGSNTLARQAAGLQASAITNALNGGFSTAADDITNLISLTGAGQPAAPTSAQSITFNTHVKDAVTEYQNSLNNKIVTAAPDSAPITSPPVLDVATEKPDKGAWNNLWDKLLGRNTDDSWNIRRMVTGDLQSFELYMHAAITDGEINMGYVREKK
jgi:hypothetical protein